MNENRLARLELAAESLLGLLLASNDNQRVVFDGLPADAKVRGAVYVGGSEDYMSPNTICLMLESSEFAEVAPGEQCPRLDLTCRLYTVGDPDA